jgi:predicted nucleic acid-binding protein
MKRLTLDASVICKWYLDPTVEADIEAARDIALALLANEIAIVQPPHWLAEVAAVTARLLPNDAEMVVNGLNELELPTLATATLYQRAIHLAVDTGAHVFDSLYHAVALMCDDCALVTADRRYFNAAAHYGRIVTLDRFRLNSMH